MVSCIYKYLIDRRKFVVCSIYIEISKLLSGAEVEGCCYRQLFNNTPLDLVNVKSHLYLDMKFSLSPNLS